MFPLCGIEALKLDYHWWISFIIRFVVSLLIEDSDATKTTTSSHRLGVRTLPSQGGNRGSNPRGKARPILVIGRS